MLMSNKLLSIKNLELSFKMYEGTLNVLKKINLELEKGEKVALVGESGSGKSVTTKLILGLLNSKLLSPLNKSWIKLGEILGIIIAPIVMALVYFVVLTPVSLIVRIFGKDLLGLKFLKKKETYWIKRKKNLGSMKKQF